MYVPDYSVDYSGLRSRPKMTQLRLRSSSFHKHGSSSGGRGFHECDCDSELSFFMATAPAFVRFHTLIL